MKKIIYLLLALPMLMVSCSNDEAVVCDEAVEVSFRAEIPQPMATRASLPNVDKVVCTVFENGEEVDILREVKDVVDGVAVTYSPRLIKGRTYDIVFWAMKNGAYDVDDMKHISRVAGQDEVNYDAFTATTSIVVEGNFSTAVMLHRPLAQMNLGVTLDDWNSVSSTFGMTPDAIELTVEARTAYNALMGMATGGDSYTYRLDVTGEEFTCKGNTYKKIAMCYVLAESEKVVSNIEFSLYDQDGHAIREDAPIIHVPLQRNYITNVVGGLLTGVINYEITFEDNGEFAGEHPFEVQ